MTTSVEPRPLLTVEQYRARELRSDIRREYVHGQVYAMAGESRAHNRVALNIATMRFDEICEGVDVPPPRAPRSTRGGA